MKIQRISFILLFTLLSPAASAQWVHATSPEGGPITCFSTSGADLFVGTTGGGVFRSSDLGTIWTPVNTNLTNTAVWSLLPSGANLFAGTYGGGVFLSTNGGSSWGSASDGIEESHALALASDGSNLFAGTLGGVFLSTDAGLSWTAVNEGLTSLSVRTLAVYRGKIYAGTYGGGVFFSTNNGASWTAASDGLTNTYVLDFAFLGSIVFAGTYGGVFRSTVDADFWEQVKFDTTSPITASRDGHVTGPATGSWDGDNAPLEGKAVYSLAVSGTDVYVATYGRGVLRSTNAGRTWTPVNAGLGTLDLSILSVCGTNFYGGTLGGEVWRRPVSDMVTGFETISTEVPTQCVLEQNYPNPFNPLTLIKYTIGGPRGWGLGTRDVSLIAYDVLGREVAVLVNERKAPGNYEVRFDASGLSSGVYFYALTAGVFSQTRKMLVVK
jgi:hypothetical protein